jgi:hypothetical protein
LTKTYHHSAGLRALYPKISIKSAYFPNPVSADLRSRSLLIGIFCIKGAKGTCAKNPQVQQAPRGNASKEAIQDPLLHANLKAVFQKTSFLENRTSYILESLSKNPVGFGKGFGKNGQKPVFSSKSKVPFPKAEVLGKPLR